MAIGFLAVLWLPLAWHATTAMLGSTNHPGGSAGTAATQGFRSIDRWFEQGFPFRSELVSYSRRFDAAIFGILPRSVIVGKDRWLFYNSEAADDGSTMEDFRGGSLPDAGTIERWRTELIRRQAWLDQRRIAYLVVMAPNKQSIYPEFLPDGWQRVQAPATRLDVTLAELGRTFHLAPVDLRGPLREAKRSVQVYHRTDSHWNEPGALIAYRAIIARVRQALPQTPPAMEEFRSIDTVFSGDVAQLARSSRPQTETATHLIPLHDPPALGADRQPVLDRNGGSKGIRFQTVPPDRVPTLITSRAGALQGCVVVFHDSFMEALIPYLSQHFDRIVYVWGGYDPEIVEREHPVLVIHENVERYLDRLFSVEETRHTGLLFESTVTGAPLQKK